MKEISIHLENGLIKGFLQVPSGSTGIILFAHGSGSGRHSPRNQFVAEELNHAGIATLLMDLFTQDEELEDEISGKLRFNIPFLGKRLLNVTSWLETQSILTSLKVGYFGASTGAAAALYAAAHIPHKIHAIVSRGGRPDLAISHLHLVNSPTLLIVGGNDTMVIDLNQKAYDLLSCEKRLEIIPGATHLFEEPGTLNQVALAASIWFRKFL